MISVQFALIGVGGVVIGCDGPAYLSQNVSHDDNVVSMFVTYDRAPSSHV